MNKLNNKKCKKNRTSKLYWFKWWLLDKILTLLFFCKPLYKSLVWCDYVIRCRRIPKRIELTDNKNTIIEHNKRGNYNYLSFYKRICFQYEVIND